MKLFFLLLFFVGLIRADEAALKGLTGLSLGAVSGDVKDVLQVELMKSGVKATDGIADGVITVSIDHMQAQNDMWLTLVELKVSARATVGTEKDVVVTVWNSGVAVNGRARKPSEAEDNQAVVNFLKEGLATRLAAAWIRTH